MERSNTAIRSFVVCHTEERPPPQDDRPVTHIAGVPSGNLVALTATYDEVLKLGQENLDGVRVAHHRASRTGRRTRSPTSMSRLKSRRRSHDDERELARAMKIAAKKTKMRWLGSAILGVALLAGMACSAPAHTTAEPAPTASLPALPAASIIASDLLADTDWRLVSLNGEPSIEEITLSLTDRVFKGYVTCDQSGGASYRGMYVARGDGTLTVHELDVTRGHGHCEAPIRLREPEDDFLPLLRRAAQYRLAEDRLELSDIEGRTVLVFVREDAPPRYTCADMVTTETFGKAYQSLEELAAYADIIVRGTVSRIDVVADQIRDRQQLWAVLAFDLDYVFKGGPSFGDGTITIGNHNDCMNRGGEYILFLSDRRDWSTRTESGFIDDPEKSDSPAEYILLSRQGEFLIKDGLIANSAAGMMAERYPVGSTASALAADIQAAVVRPPSLRSSPRSRKSST